MQRLPVEFTKSLPAPRPIRHPQPAHTPNFLVRPPPTGFHLSAATSSATGGYHSLPVFSLPPGTSLTPSGPIPAPVLPYPGMPFPPFALESSAHELQQLNFLQSINRAQHATSVQENSKIKTPINRNYLELAMLVCNTFRGKLFPCPHCRYVTDRRNNLKRHISTMHQTCDKLLECCGVSFSTKASLREHIMIFHHNGYSCPYCGRRFCRKALLKRHLSVHSGQKDYICPSCDYATSHKSNLERHKRIHERLKLGEDGTLFDCGDFTSHALSQSPDTTGNSCLDSEAKGDNYVDIDSSDDSSDIDVTEESLLDNEKLRSYPIYVPNVRRELIGPKCSSNNSTKNDTFECDTTKRQMYKLESDEHVVKNEIPLNDRATFYQMSQHIALDFSKTMPSNHSAASSTASVSQQKTSCVIGPNSILDDNVGKKH
ncbi:replication initiator 1-like [Dreissena polymorpha]|nr:replication initiator 1-like [Dreissena polymorpha]